MATMAYRPDYLVWARLVQTPSYRCVILRAGGCPSHDLADSKKVNGYLRLAAVYGGPSRRQERAKRQICHELLDSFGAANLAELGMFALSYGEQKRVEIGCTGGRVQLTVPRRSYGCSNAGCERAARQTNLKRDSASHSLSSITVFAFRPLSDHMIACVLGSSFGWDGMELLGHGRSGRSRTRKWTTARQKVGAPWREAMAWWKTPPSHSGSRRRPR
jgi:hypothetical protein